MMQFLFLNIPLSHSLQLFNIGPDILYKECLIKSLYEVISFQTRGDVIRKCNCTVAAVQVQTVEHELCLSDPRA